jgi:hypothetical protein
MRRPARWPRPWSRWGRGRRVPRGYGIRAAAGVGGSRVPRAPIAGAVARPCRTPTSRGARTHVGKARRRRPAGVSVTGSRRCEVVSAPRRRLRHAGLRFDTLPFYGAVDGGAADAKQVRDLGGVVLAAVHQGDQMRFLATVELGLLAAEPSLGLWRPACPRGYAAGSDRTRLCGHSWFVKPHPSTNEAIANGGAVAVRGQSASDPAVRAECGMVGRGPVSGMVGRGPDSGMSGRREVMVWLSAEITDA